MKTLTPLPRKLNFLLSISFILFFCLLAKGQQLKHQNVVIVNDTATIKFKVLVGDPKIKPEANAVYSWYFDSAIYNTAGEYSGMLLDGEYKEYDKNGRLRVQGTYKEGGKTGNWKAWTANGEAKEYISVKNEQKKQNIIAEDRDTVNHPTINTGAAKIKKERIYVNVDDEDALPEMSWSQKKRYWINRWKFQQAQKRNAKENGDQIRRKNRKEEKYIASPNGI